MDATTSDKIAELLSVYENAKRAAVRLYDAILAKLRERSENSGNGTVLLKASGNGASFETGIDPGLSPSDAKNILVDLLTRCTNATTKLIALGTPNPSDEEIFSEMMDKLPIGGIKSFSTDFSGLTR